MLGCSRSKSSRSGLLLGPAGSRPPSARPRCAASRLSAALATVAALAAGAAAVCGATGCAAHRDDSYVSRKLLGDQAYSAGRLDEAARAYAAAADRAKEPADRDEALFLSASAYRRVHDLARAERGFERLAGDAHDHGAAARADFELARIAYETGRPAQGDELLDRIVERFADEGIARRALSIRLARLDEISGIDGAIAWIDGMLRRDPARGALDEDLSYARALRLEREGQIERARDELVACAARHPYPRGTLFDDALYRAAELDDRMGRPERAIEDLRRMLQSREPATFVGSYERPRFADAQWRIAELYRDRLGNRPAARAAFHEFFASFTTSRRRDDALWEEAKLYRADHDEEGSCRTLLELVREFPESRYAACGRQLCAQPGEVDGGVCHGYLLR